MMILFFSKVPSYAGSYRVESRLVSSSNSCLSYSPDPLELRTLHFCVYWYTIYYSSVDKYPSKYLIFCSKLGFRSVCHNQWEIRGLHGDQVSQMAFAFVDMHVKNRHKLVVKYSPLAHGSYDYRWYRGLSQLAKSIHICRRIANKLKHLYKRIKTPSTLELAMLSDIGTGQRHARR